MLFLPCFGAVLIHLSFSTHFFWLLIWIAIFNVQFLFKFNHSSIWIKALNISLIQSTKNELSNSLLGRFELMNIYPTSSTSQSTLSLKTNWTFKIAIQNNNQKKWVEKDRWIKTTPKQGRKNIFVLLQSIALWQQSIASVHFFKKTWKFVVTIDCTITAINYTLLKKEKQHFKRPNSCSNFPSNTLWSWIQLTRKFH